MAKILFITSSSRKKSNSNFLAAQAAKAAEKNGHEVTTMDIARLQIEPCRACGACRKLNNGRCVQKDDMNNFYPLLEEADTLIFVSPVYWFNLCGQIKQFIDRCYAIAGMPMPDGGICFGKKKIGLVLAHEGDDPFDSGGINAIRSIQDICAYLGSHFAGALYGCANAEG
ncbi:flavodoxin family protein, partial [Desulfovibrio sp. OttesenSCG-928-G15]|nr:flavodoxin family protein [Desulfovibrio sp. OttesenSCG-928-G15]